MSANSPRLAVRALILHESRLLLVNAYPDDRSDLWCAPGGGVKAGSALPENLIREVHEETGLRVVVDRPVLVNEFHEPEGDFHQVDVYFRCRLTDPGLPPGWRDPAGIVTRRRFFAQHEIASIRYKPDSLADVAWGDPAAITYDPLERLVR